MVNSIHRNIVAAGALIPGALLCAWQKLPETTTNTQKSMLCGLKYRAP